MPPKDTINRFVLQECGNLLGGCLTCEELGGLLTGDDGVGFENRDSFSQPY